MTMDSLAAAVREDEWLMARYEAGREQEAGGYDRRTRALIVDDEPDIVRLIAPLLEREGIEVSVATTGSQALEVARAVMPDLVILDLPLPRLAGVEVCRELRQFSDAYVIMVTARDDETDLLVGLAVGADDYLTKPFSNRELVARVRARLRRPRTSAADAEPRVFGDLSVDPVARLVRVGGEEIDLTKIEFDLLDTLSARPRMAFTRAMIIEAVWGEDWVGDDHLVDVHLGNLRRKLRDDPRKPRYIRTVRGVGYRMVDAQ